MTHITLPRAVVEQALEALESVYGDSCDALHALRAALAQQAEAVEPVACLIGIKGSAFDLPTTKRAYTYAEQPGNVVASKLGLACNAAAWRSPGDSIDHGLKLLQELQKVGFGVFDLGAEYIAPPQRKPLTDEEIAAEWRKASEFAGKSEGAVTTSQFVQIFARAIERAHGIGEGA